jgi:protein O-GlcNAc transferase
VTLVGGAHPGRVGASLMTRVGLPDLIADTPETYVRACARLAGDRAALAGLRSRLRGRVSACPLGAPAVVVRDIEAAFRGMWEQWCSKAASQVSPGC